MKTYTLRFTDGYDSNNLVLATTDRDLVMDHIAADPPTHVVDYYVIETWEDGQRVESETWTKDAWEEREAASCNHDAACCASHGSHSSPHRDCILR